LWLIDPPVWVELVSLDYLGAANSSARPIGKLAWSAWASISRSLTRRERRPASSAADAIASRRHYHNGHDDDNEQHEHGHAEVVETTEVGNRKHGFCGISWARFP
jgi:hypothetical protein